MNAGVRVRGWFEPEHLEVRLGEEFAVTIVLRNEGGQDAFLLVPHGRANGLEIAVLDGGAYDLSGMEHEPEPGLVGQVRLAPGEEYRQEYPLSRWLSPHEPGRYVVECRCTVTAAAQSAAEQDVTDAPIEVVSRIDLDVLPSSIADEAMA